MGSPNKLELKLLQKYSRKCSRIIETGSGLSTKIFKKNTDPDAKFISIDINKSLQSLNDVHYLCGWSITYEDLIKYTDTSVKSRYNTLDKRIALEKKPELMTGKTGLLYEAIDYLGYVDFFFCDTGEYCGWAEWNIIKDHIKKGGRIACHDIYYPKSIKCYKIKEYIKKSSQWRICVKTKSEQGLLIAERTD